MEEHYSPLSRCSSYIGRLGSWHSCVGRSGHSGYLHAHATLSRGVVQRQNFPGMSSELKHRSDSQVATSQARPESCFAREDESRARVKHGTAQRAAMSIPVHPGQFLPLQHSIGLHFARTESKPLLPASETQRSGTSSSSYCQNSTRLGPVFRKQIPVELHLPGRGRCEIPSGLISPFSPADLSADPAQTQPLATLKENAGRKRSHESVQAEKPR